MEKPIINIYGNVKTPLEYKRIYALIDDGKYKVKYHTQFSKDIKQIPTFEENGIYYNETEYLKYLSNK